MLKKIYRSNPWFLIPFTVWVVVGSIMYFSMSKQELFALFNTHHTDAIDKMMFSITWMGQGEIIVPVLLGLLAIPRYRNWWYFITACICNMLPFLISQGIKSWLDWPRPLNFFNHAVWIHYVPTWPELLYRSFPSGHSEAAFSFFCFLSLLLMPDTKKFGALFFVLAMGVGYSRMYLAAHFFSDVYVGSILGTGITTIGYLLMEQVKDRMTQNKTNITV